MYCCRLCGDNRNDDLLWHGQVIVQIQYLVGFYCVIVCSLKWA